MHLASQSFAVKTKCGVGRIFLSWLAIFTSWPPKWKPWGSWTREAAGRYRRAPRLCRLWVLSNLSTLRARTSDKRPLVGGGCMSLTTGNLAEQKEVLLRTKWLNQAWDSRPDASLVSATGFSLSALNLSRPCLPLIVLAQGFGWKIKAGFWLVRKQSRGSGSHSQRRSPLKDATLWPDYLPALEYRNAAD